MVQHFSACGRLASPGDRLRPSCVCIGDLLLRRMAVLTGSLRSWQATPGMMTLVSSDQRGVSLQRGRRLRACRHVFFWEPRRSFDISCWATGSRCAPVMAHHGLEELGDCFREAGPTCVRRLKPRTFPVTELRYVCWLNPAKDSGGPRDHEADERQPGIATGESQPVRRVPEMRCSAER